MESGCGLGIQRMMKVLENINITEKQMAFEKKPNCKLTCAQVHSPLPKRYGGSYSNSQL